GGNPLAATVVMQIHGNTFGEEDPAYDQAVGRRIEVQAGPDGRYEVKRLTPGVWKLTASHEGYADYLERALVLNGEETVVVKDVLLGSEFTIAGVVHDDAGRPVPEALVSVARSRPRPPVSSQGVADAEGYFVIRGLPEGVYTVAAEADGFSRTSLPRVEAGSEDLAIVLHKRGSVSGRVTGPDGRPITRFSLELMQVNRAAPTFHQVGAKQQFAAPTGEFLFDNIEPGAYRLLATGPGFSPTYSPGFAVDREEVQGIDVQLSVGGRLTGTLVGPDGLPVSGAEVKVHGRDWTEESSYGLFGGRSPDPNNVPAQVGPTDQDGVFELRNAFPGTLKLEFSHPSFLSEYLVVDVVEGGQQDVGVVKLRRGGSIVGVGIGGDGKALSGGSVFLTRQEETGFGWFSKNGRLDTQGRFRFAGLRTGTYRVVVAPADSGGMSFFPETEMNSRTVYVAEGQEVELRLTAQ
ncbi:MAG: carboxypeptidase regulatory-like domain-containing protein, partial [Planctomycetes bacterium]|nr:carboxypeptidase regulatory-like domain-containing protein [Planctomycetota bacterium]